MRVEYDEIIFDNATQFNTLPRKSLSTLTSTTPDVANVEFFLTTGSLTITNFLQGSDCQRIHILGNGTTIISHNSNIKTNTGANKTLLADKIYRFTYLNNIWYEDE